MPAEPELIWVKLDLEPEFSGRLMGLVYKPSPLFLEIKTARGPAARYRLIPGVARGGFLLSPLVSDGMSFAMLGSTQWKDLLANQMDGVDVPPDELLFEPELVVRGSTGPAPRG